MRTKKASWNLITSLLRQFIVFACSFLTGRLILQTFGSETNGILSSIKQFLGIIALLDGGIGGVTRAALYKPLASNDQNEINTIYNTTERFLKRIAVVFLIYILFLALLFKKVSNTQISWHTVFCLVLVCGASTFFEYYVGITASLLIMASQRSYIINIANGAAYILSAVAILLSIQMGMNIVAVELLSVLPFVLRPFIFNGYIKRKYHICRTSEENKAIVRQRWDGFIHQVVFYINKNVDIILLTVFTSPKEISVYSTYLMVTNALRAIIETIPASIEAALGDMIAKKENNALQNRFEEYEIIIGIASVTMFCTMYSTCIPFVKIYTEGVTDVQYLRPVFAGMMTLWGFCSCIRIPYEGITKVAGHYKETRNGAIIEAVINVAFSLMLIRKYGAVGITAATIIASSLRIAQYVVYLRDNILKREIRVFIKRQVVNCANIMICIFCYTKLFGRISTLSFLEWIIQASLVFLCNCTLSLIVNVVIYPRTLNRIIKMIVH